MTPITQEKLKELFVYDPDSGLFVRRKRVAPNAPSGQVVGTKGTHGYLRVSIGNKYYALHRLAWLYVYGELPSGQVDHINRVRTDNRIGNLQSVTQCENMHNLSISSRNTSGHQGVAWNRSRSKWQVQVSAYGVRKYIGLFDDFDEAVAAREAAKIECQPYARAIEQAVRKNAGMK